MCVGKTILITGGTGKLGSQFVKHFASKKNKVIFTSRSSRNINTFINRSDVKEYKDCIYGISVDLEKEGSTSTIINFLEDKNLFTEVLINNARNIEYVRNSAGKTLNRRAWLGEFLLGVLVPCELSLALANYPGSKLKNIINISSMYGIVAPNPNLYCNPEKDSPINYSVVKSALIHLTKELAVRLGPKGIRVNCISYGGIEGRVNEDFKNRYAHLCPLGRMLKDEEVTGAIDFLVSDRSIGMLGHNLVVDGGWSVW